jgi:hypothetical protein
MTKRGCWSKLPPSMNRRCGGFNPNVLSADRFSCRGRVDFSLWLSLLAAVAALHSALDSQGQKPEDPYAWFSVPIVLKNLPPGCDSVPVASTVDFHSLLERASVTGLVDARSLRLFHLDSAAVRKEVPVQFVLAPQTQLATRRLLAGTSPGVSYLSEYTAQESVPNIHVAGRLCWLAEANSDGAANYRLEFGALREGSAVQVPYAPHNLAHFDADSHATPLRRFPRMQIRPQQPLDGAISIYELNQLVATYHIGPTADAVTNGTPKFLRPFFYPVNGRDGISLTEFGKPHDPTGSHAHHYSLWIAHANVDGHDFWSEKGGLIVHDGFDELEDGPVFCRIVQKLRWVFENTDVLHERRIIRFYARAADCRIVDLEMEFMPAAARPVQLGKTNFGFLAARVAQSLSPFDGGGEILNSLGDRNEQRAHMKHADWIDQSGPILPNKWAGVAILDHPQNLNHPTAFHCRNDGWAGAAFNLEQPYEIQSGTPLRLKYRVLLHEGNAAEAQIARRYKDYSAVPVIEVGAPQRR